MNFQTFNDFLPTEILTQILQEINQRGWNYGWRSRAARNSNIPFSHWNVDFAGTGAENGIDVSTKLPKALAAAWQHIQTNHCPTARLVRCYANGHTYGVEGYPHTDSIRAGDKTLLVYLNQTWKRDWGGETVFYNDDEVLHAELPKYNKAILFDGNITHVAKGVARVCPSLRITLMFKILESVDPVRDQLQEFLSTVQADEAGHSANTLTGHLLRTYDLLKQAGQTQEVCNAGAVHSIFGTNIFAWHDRLNYNDRPKIEAVAGFAATRLAEIFSKLPRPGVLEMNLGTFTGSLLALDGTTMSISAEDFAALCAIEAANLQDQSGLDPYPGLKQLWAELNNK